MWFTRISIGNPVLATMMMVAFVVLGLFSYQRLQVDQFPDITFPVVVVQTEYPGASPESVESDVTRKIEEVVNTINGIDSLTSRSYEGNSVVIIRFLLTVDPSQAAQDVREKVSLVKSIFRNLFLSVQPGPVPLKSGVKRTQACTIRPRNSPPPIVPVTKTLFGSASCAMKCRNAVDDLPFDQSNFVSPAIERSAHVA